MSRDLLLNETLGRHRYRLVRRLCGPGHLHLYQATSTTTDENNYLASVLHNDRDIPVEQLWADLSYQAPGVLELLDICRLDPSSSGDLAIDGHRRQKWVMLERLPAGSWLPDLTFKALGGSKAIRLAVSVGEMLGLFAEKGRLHTSVRPELLWARLDGDQPMAAGMATRCDDFFLHRHKHTIGRIFDRGYSPLESGPNETTASLSFPLALMIAEWATEQWPFPIPWYGNPGPTIEDRNHPALEVSLPLQRVLHRALTEDAAKRIPLAEFLDELRALTPEQLGA